MSDRVCIAKLASVPNFASAAYAIFKKDDNGLVHDVVRVFEIIQQKQYEIKDPETGEVIPRQKLERGFQFFDDTYFFNSKTAAFISEESFEYSRDLSPEEDLHKNYVTQVQQVKEQSKKDTKTVSAPEANA